MSSYDKLGASATKAGLHQALKKSGVSEDSTLFAQVGADLAGDPDFSCFLHCDGAGTKTLAAYMSYLETKNPDDFAGLAQDALVMNLDDVLCLGIPDSLLLANTIGRNARLIDDEVVAALIGKYRQLGETLREAGVPLEITGGETADCGDVVRTLMVDAVMTGRIKNESIIRADRIAPGDVIVGLSSSGKASYEDRANSGIGSNGLTLARHALLSSYYSENFPEVVDEGIDSSIAYQGPFRATELPEGLGMSVGEALSSPTRTYAPLLLKIYRELGREVHGAIHVTGGALTKVLRFGQPGNHYIKDNLFDPPPVFSLIQEHGKVSWKEMHQVFNMGQRMELYLGEAHAQRIIDIATEFDIDARVIGHVEKSSSTERKVLVKSRFGEFEYSL